MIVLPWPDKRLFPNYKRANHWRKYRQQERDARALGWGLACEALSAEDRQTTRAGEDKILLTVTFYPPDRRVRDDDGMIGAIKNFRDGIADALGVDDRRFRPVYLFADPEKPGRVTVEFIHRNEPVDVMCGCAPLAQMTDSAMEKVGPESALTLDPTLTRNAERSVADEA